MPELGSVRYQSSGFSVTGRRCVSGTSPERESPRASSRPKRTLSSLVRSRQSRRSAGLRPYSLAMTANCENALRIIPNAQGGQCCIWFGQAYQRDGGAGTPAAKFDTLLFVKPLRGLLRNEANQSLDSRPAQWLVARQCRVEKRVLTRR